MNTSPEPALGKQQEQWGSKLGVVLAVAGSAVGLGNFLRFPGQAVNNGGGAFMIPYFISFLVLGIPIAWCEWTMGRLGGRFRQNSAPGIMYALWPRSGAKAMGAMGLLVPVTIYMYYVLLEGWCLDYFLEFATGGFADKFHQATAGITEHAGEVEAVVGATTKYHEGACGIKAHGAIFTGGRMLWLVLVCFLINFVVIYQGVTRGIEKFCKWAMPLLILCALIILARVLTLPGISSGLGFMWNPDWAALKNPQVWLAAAGQIFFSLSVGFGLILCYSSYVKSDEDVVLTGLSASSTNEFCEVILGGLIVVPTAFLFLGAENAKGGTFGLGFETIPAIMNFMPGGPYWGSFFGAMWFGLLFLAAVTSSLSMLQPAIAFLEDGFGLRRRSSVALLGVITALGAIPIMYFTKGYLAMDTTDFWCNLTIIIAATCQVLVFGWVIGAKRGVKEMNRGADFKVPRFMPIMIRYVTPTFLLLVLAAWSWQNLPGYIEGMSPATKGAKTRIATCQSSLLEVVGLMMAEDGLSDDQVASATATYLAQLGLQVEAGGLAEWVGTVRAAHLESDLADFTAAAVERCGAPAAIDDEHPALPITSTLADESVTAAEAALAVRSLLQAEHEPAVKLKVRPWVEGLRSKAQAAAVVAAGDANIARLVFLGIVSFYIILLALSDIACRTRIGRLIKSAEVAGDGWEA